MILTPWGVTFHPVVVIGLGKNLLFKSVLAHCEKLFSYKIGSHLFRRIYVRNVYFAGLQTAIVILVSKSEH